jgi:hypothetical protein
MQAVTSHVKQCGWLHDTGEGVIFAPSPVLHGLAAAAAVAAAALQQTASHALCAAQGVGFDLVASGINRGDNCGLHVIYSGTVGAAREAACKVRRTAIITHVDCHERLFVHVESGAGTGSMQGGSLRALVLCYPLHVSFLLFVEAGVAGRQHAM